MNLKFEKSAGMLKSTVGKLAMAAGVCLAMSAGTATAGPIDAFIGGPWLEFAFDAPPGSLADGCTGGTCTPSSGGNSVFLDPSPWTYTSASATVLRVTDAFIIASEFDVFDLGVLIGSTSSLGGNAGSNCGDDPVGCFGVASSGLFNLAAGSHSITISPSIVTGPGAAYFRVDLAAAAVSEPAMLLLFGTGLAGIGMRRRKKIGA